MHDRYSVYSDHNKKVQQSQKKADQLKCLLEKEKMDKKISLYMFSINICFLKASKGLNNKHAHILSNLLLVKGNAHAQLYGMLQLKNI